MSSTPPSPREDEDVSASPTATSCDTGRSLTRLLLRRVHENPDVLELQLIKTFDSERLEMAVYGPAILCSFWFLLTGAQDPTVTYQFARTCAVLGSTVTIPCSFTPRESFYKDGKEIRLRVVRVLWCQNSLQCRKPSPAVFDSNSTNNDPRYRYLGDMKGICTLQIRDVQRKDGKGPDGSQDDSTFRFRIEADHPIGDFTNLTGVIVTVVGGIKLRIKTSSNESRRGQSVSLQCTSSFCTFHHLNVTWFRDGHALPESGHALQLGPLTAGDSGNYTCALSTDVNTRSDPFSLQVEDGDGDGDGPEDGGKTRRLALILGGVSGVLLVLVVLVLLCFTLRKRAAAKQQSIMGAETELKVSPGIQSCCFWRKLEKSDLYGSRCYRW
ncbi:uncharacterized protein LOC133440779 [Cololabis saira]|uniref:uncharacterized protein LOC133440779 n=1 Tax=Cololabis saira TaxID=129043 RepID=UPI002AD5290F|nr:uncharacterized protein LOC133440779 [Cololabis saira]